jgi:hypothetical protein
MSFSGKLLSLGVAAPAIYIAIIILVAMLGGRLRAVEFQWENKFARILAVQELIAAICNISRQLTWESSEHRSEVAHHLSKAAYFVQFGLPKSIDASTSIELQRDRGHVYRGASRLLQNWADQALFGSAELYESLRSSVQEFLEKLINQNDSDLPRLEIEDAPIAKVPSLQRRVLRHVKVIFIAIVPGACLAMARFAQLPLPNGLGGAATLFSIAWATATLLLQFDTSFDERLTATRRILTVIRGDKNADQDGRP